MDKRKVLISVWDKEPFLPFARALHELGWELVSSSGTAAALRNEGLPVTEVADLTGYPHILGGRVKTLHPAVAGGILARRDVRGDLDDLARHDIAPIDMVICTLYPFEEKARSGSDLAELLEHIDIGGITLLRAAAKNFPQVIVLSDPADCAGVERELRDTGDATPQTRERLGLKAFERTSMYDATIVSGLRQTLGTEEESLLGQGLAFPLRKAQELRYGENPHQTAGLYLPPLADLPWELLGGKPLSFNNLLDLDAAMRGAALFSDNCTCVLIKHTTPCGIATGSSPARAFERARACDPVSAFGGIAGFSRPLDAKACEALAAFFLEILVAPGFDPQGLAHLLEKRPNLRVLHHSGGRVWPLEMRSTWSGLLVQEDVLPELPSPERGEWSGTPRPDLWSDLLFAWKAAALSKSNAIAVVKEGETIGIGRGFTSRVDAVRWALSQAGERARGAVLASDAFFPFPDSIEIAAEAGIAAVIQPGGSVKDEDVKRAAQNAGVAMFLSGYRTFRH